MDLKLLIKKGWVKSRLIKEDIYNKNHPQEFQS